MLTTLEQDHAQNTLAGIAGTDPQRKRSGRLRTLITRDHYEFDLANLVQEFLRGLIFGRTVAGERLVVALELDHHVVLARWPFDRLGRSAAHQEFAAVFGKGDPIELAVFGISSLVLDIEPCHPIAFGHVSLTCWYLADLATRAATAPQRANVAYALAEPASRSPLPQPYFFSP